MFRIRTKTRRFQSMRPLDFPGNRAENLSSKPTVRNEKKRPVQHEQKLQIMCVEWFRLQFPNEIIFHIPNGKRRMPVEVLILKRMGMLPGIPDLFIASPSACGKYHGIYLELKARIIDENGNVRKSRPNELQQEIIARLRKKGYRVEVIDNFDDFVKITSLYLRAA